MNLGKISSSDLALFLSMPYELLAEFDQARVMSESEQEKLFRCDCTKPVWCHLYELPAKQHIAIVLQGFLSDNHLRELVASENQLKALPNVLEKAQSEIDGWEADEDELDDLRRNAAAVLGLGLSVALSFRSMLVFGHYLNDLIAIVRSGTEDADNALLSAVKIDPTVLGCPTVVAHVSRAVLLNDQRFLAALGKAMTGKLTKREDKTYQRQRLILQILHETGAPQLSEADLYRLFVEELKIASRDSNADEGSVASNLRQFAYQFMKQKVVSQKAANSLAGQTAPAQ